MGISTLMFGLVLQTLQSFYVYNFFIPRFASFLFDFQKSVPATSVSFSLCEVAQKWCTIEKGQTNQKQRK